jgi:hypothetical protein
MDVVLARKIVAAIVDDIEGRSGIGDEWQNIDDETQAEIMTEWTELLCNGGLPPK